MILDQLREATATAHANLERQFDLKRRTSSLEAYKQILRDFVGFLRPLETRLSAQLGSLRELDMPARCKLALLERDLVTLGDSTSTIDRLPTCDDAPIVDGAASAFGVLYVLEGSTLGGRVIAPLLEQRLGLNAAHGASYFNCYGARVAEMWNAFRHAICIFADDQKQAANVTGSLTRQLPIPGQIVTTAQETFSTLAGWLSGGDLRHALHSTTHRRKRSIARRSG